MLLLIFFIENRLTLKRKVFDDDIMLWLYERQFNLYSDKTEEVGNSLNFFSARQRIRLARFMLSPDSQSVRLSVRHTAGSVENG